MRTKKALYNMSSSLILQFVTIISGFVLPRLIIGTFGSETNGLIASISQFLGYIALIESGVGGVTRAALYKPLTSKTIDEVSGVLKAAEIFFKKIAFIFLVYAFLIAVFFKEISDSNFDWMFVFTLVIIISITTFAKYYFGVVYSILLQADQKKYISANINTITLILNTIFISILIVIGLPIHIVKLTSVLILTMRPLLLNWYVKRHYNIDKKALPNHSALKQKWDGLGHHIAYFLRANTAVMTLTVFATLKEVSVYSVHAMVAVGIRQLTTIFSNSLGAALGNMLANDEEEVLSKSFNAFEFMIHFMTVTIFTTAGLVIVPFISLYTRGITDINYVRPYFAYVFLLSEAIYCLRSPYNAIVFAAGHFKQTKRAAYIEAFFSVVLSIILIQFWGLLGLAIAMSLVMIYRIVDFALYLSRNILKRKMIFFIRRQIISTVNVVAIVIVILTLLPNVYFTSYLNFFTYGTLILVISTIITTVFSMVFYSSELKNLFSKLKNLKN